MPFLCRPLFSVITRICRQRILLWHSYTYLQPPAATASVPLHSVCALCFLSPILFSSRTRWNNITFPQKPSMIFSPSSTISSLRHRATKQVLPFTFIRPVEKSIQRPIFSHIFCVARCNQGRNQAKSLTDIVDESFVFFLRSFCNEFL